MYCKKPASKEKKSFETGFLNKDLHDLMRKQIRTNQEELK